MTTTLDSKPAPAGVHFSGLTGGVVPPVVFFLAAIKLLVTMAFSNQYGFHRDELYYLACARHPALGYVDFPPIAPMLARLDVFLFGTSLVALRLLPELAGSIIVILAALMARELGGGRWAQTLAALCIVVGGVYLGGDWLFETVGFDQLCWAITLYLLARLLRTGNLRLWPAVGLAFGVGLETKYTIVGLGAGIVVGILATRERTQLRTPLPWLAAGIAALLIAPNLGWQVQHGWPSVSYLLTHHGRIAQETSRISFVLEQLILANFLALPIIFLGFRRLFREPRFRMLGWAAVTVEVVFFLAGGKSYYATPIFVLLYAAGSVSVEAYIERGRRRVRRTLVIVPLVVCALVFLPITLPVLPASAMAHAKLYTVRTDYGDMVGWPEFVRQIAGVYHALPPGERAQTQILVGNYGEAGAIDFYGPKYGLPPALSGHLTYYYWKPPHVVARAVILVEVPPSMLGGQCRSARQVATIHNALGVENEEQGNPVILCQGPRINLDRVWPAQRHYD
jgi:Dolichyl-phosphate-mannose-protein mannosyltransferase